MLTLEMLQNLWPHGDQHLPGLLEALAAVAPDIFPKYGLNSDLAIAHAMAQFSQECGGGLEMVENLNYSAHKALLNTWPLAFQCGYGGKIRAQLPQDEFADAVYGGRMGNAPPPSDDGWNFRGRGLSQVTGREGYTALTAKVGLDLVNNPDIATSADQALACAVADFVLCGCLPFALNDDVKGVTLKLNGGLIGFSGRQTWLVKWKSALDVA